MSKFLGKSAFPASLDRAYYSGFLKMQAWYEYAISFSMDHFND